MSPPRLAVLISGTGRNLQAILEACADGRIDALPCLVLSNRPGAGGLARAEQAGVPTQVIDHRGFASREDFDQALGDALEAAAPDLIALAGFMRILSPDFVRRFSGRMFNIHPSLLPKYRGLNTHQRALDNADAWHGASVHYVTEELDAGAVVKQGRIRILADDDATSLADRVMQQVELKLYPEILGWAAAGRLRYHDGAAELDGQRLAAPLVGDYE